MLDDDSLLTDTHVFEQIVGNAEPAVDIRGIEASRLHLRDVFESTEVVRFFMRHISCTEGSAVVLASVKFIISHAPANSSQGCTMIACTRDELSTLLSVVSNASSGHSHSETSEDSVVVSVEAKLSMIILSRIEVHATWDCWRIFQGRSLWAQGRSYSKRLIHNLVDGLVDLLPTRRDFWRKLRPSKVKIRRLTVLLVRVLV